MVIEDKISIRSNDIMSLVANNTITIKGSPVENDGRLSVKANNVILLPDFSSINGGTININ